MVGRLSPLWIEVFNERILNFFGRVIDEIGKIPNDPNKAANIFIDNYYLHRNEISHSFSESLLNDVKNNLIVEKIEYNYKHLRVSEQVKERLITCCLDYFIEEAYEIVEDIEVNEEKYVSQKYPSFFSCLVEFEQSPEKMNELGHFLNQQLKHKWKEFNYIWQAYKEHSLPRVELFRKAFNIFEDFEFIAFFTHPMFNRCIRIKDKEQRKNRRERKKSKDFTSIIDDIKNF